MASFSLTEKLAATGAFLALVAMVVGTEDDPGLVVTGQDAVKELRPAAPPPAPAIPEASQSVLPAPVDVPQVEQADATAPPRPERDRAERAQQFHPELGRVPLDFSNGPPPG